MKSDADKTPFGAQLKSATDFVDPAHVYYAINPIDPASNRNLKGARSPRASINVTAFRNFLFEIDNLPLNVQLELLRYLAPHVPFAAVTFSGSSSYHAIVSVVDTLPFKPHSEAGIAEYSQAWTALSKHLNALSSEFLKYMPTKLFDPQCKDPARLSRVPGAIRPDTSQVQQSVSGFGGYVSSDLILSLMSRYSETPTYFQAEATPASEGERGALSKRTLEFLSNWSPAVAHVWPWHPEFIFAVKDLQSQNYTFSEAERILMSVTGHLDSNDKYQMRDIWSRTNFRLNFRKRA
jgi:hypothetical protein